MLKHLLIAQVLRAMLLMLTLGSFNSVFAADGADPNVEDRKQLLKIFAEMESGINEQNIDRMVAQMDEKATVIWLNAEASDRKSTRLNSSHVSESRMPSSA